MNWKEDGVKIVRAGELDSNTPQTPGMTGAAAITHARTGATKLWAGTVLVQPDAKTGPHHHGELETVLYIVRGRARMRWGERLEFSGEAGPGDFIYVPLYVPHQEINALPDEPCEAVVVRSGQDPVGVNLDLESPEPGSAALDCFFPSSHLLRCAAAIRFRAATDIFRRLRFGLSEVAAGEFGAPSKIALSSPICESMFRFCSSKPRIAAAMISWVSFV